MHLIQSGIVNTYIEHYTVKIWDLNTAENFCHATHVFIHTRMVCVYVCVCVVCKYKTKCVTVQIYTCEYVIIYVYVN